MLEADSAWTLSNPMKPAMILAPEVAPKPKLLDRLREALRSRHYSLRPEFRYGLLHLTHGDLFWARDSLSPCGRGSG
jgi:hypothetical protein